MVKSASRRPKGALALTPDLVALTMRAIEDTGPDPGVEQFNDADYDAAVAATLAGHAADDIWIFACGSLIWNPACDVVEERIGTARGWHRAFRINMTRWRGTKEQPGLMMGLDRGGQCTGVLYRIPAGTAEANLAKLFRREMTRKPPTNMPRWLRVETDGGPLAAIAFVMDKKGFAYAGIRTHEETAEILAKACGHWGSGAEYLHNTIVKLAEYGIHDRNLWRLQALVAERIKERNPSPGAKSIEPRLSPETGDAK